MRFTTKPRLRLNTAERFIRKRISADEFIEEEGAAEALNQLASVVDETAFHLAQFIEHPQGDTQSAEEMLERLGL